MTRLPLLLLALCLFIGKAAYADSLTLKQRLLMPGPLTQHHAEFESDCESCHVTFDKKAMTVKCLDCHEEVQEDRSERKGFHGLNPSAVRYRCNSCHLDHEGREFDIVGLNLATFDHNHTNFHLDNAHALVECFDCHDPKETFRETDSDCVSCHKDDDIHGNNLDDDCQQCHKTTRWTDLKPFDHQKTDFPLFGSHEEVACVSCHKGQTYKFQQTECIGCHITDDVHMGAHGTQCKSCHTEESWTKTLFDHDKETDFSLLGAHDELPCRACHAPSQTDKSKTPDTCIGCHKNDDHHLSRFGDDCESCHNNDRWTQVKFDHDRDTDFMLTGQHKDQTCTQCHTETLEVELESECISCHKADDVHKSSTMTVCGDCHTTKQWKGDVLFDHEFTQFPLVGMHAIVACTTCHSGHEFTTLSTQCIDCHKSDDSHSGALGEQCSTCHNPNGWKFWQFDHDTQTHFPLRDAHAGVACNDCHKPGTQPQKNSPQCVSCHLADDIHKGAFGPSCGDCHSTRDFSDVLMWRSQQ